MTAQLYLNVTEAPTLCLIALWLIAMWGTKLESTFQIRTVLVGLVMSVELFVTYVLMGDYRDQIQTPHFTVELAFVGIVLSMWGLYQSLSWANNQEHYTHSLLACALIQLVAVAMWMAGVAWWSQLVVIDVTGWCMIVVICVALSLHYLLGRRKVQKK